MDWYERFDVEISYLYIRFGVRDLVKSRISNGDLQTK